MFTTTPQRTRARARRLIIVVVLLVVAVTVVLVARHATAPPSPSPAEIPPGVAPSPTPSGPVDEATALATRHMLTLPPEAALPHELTTATAGPPITVPRPAPIANRVISDGFPATAEGALGWLTDFNETALRGGDPATYARAYGESALPHAPSLQGSGPLALLTSFRNEAGIRPGELTPGLTVTYDVSQGLIKGPPTTAGSRWSAPSGSSASTTRARAPAWASATARPCAGPEPPGASLPAPAPPTPPAHGRAAPNQSRPATGR